MKREGDGGTRKGNRTGQEAKAQSRDKKKEGNYRGWLLRRLAFFLKESPTGDGNSLLTIVAAHLSHKT